MFSGDQSDVAKSVWAKSREDRILVDHLLRQGHYSAALRLAQSSGTEVSLGERGGVGGPFKVMHQLAIYNFNIVNPMSTLFLRKLRKISFK